MKRPVYMVLSPRSLNYAQLSLRTLLHHSVDDLALTLITDSAEDRSMLQEALASLAIDPRHSTAVFAEEDFASAEADRFAYFPHLRSFRRGHPCWRKITDPALICKPAEEMILLDPDLYFPNRFRFEETPQQGLLLMWQKPNCLLPPSVVYKALDEQVHLARHVDIGVAHWRLSSSMEELEWLDWLIGKLGGKSLPKAMHVEAIVWSAIAMRYGGGYLDPEYWVCWHRSQRKRIRRKLGEPGTSILKSEAWQQMKCFHAGGEAKWWLRAMEDTRMFPPMTEQTTAGKVIPYVELSSIRYNCEQFLKNAIGRLGYYRLFAAASK